MSLCPELFLKSFWKKIRYVTFIGTLVILFQAAESIWYWNWNSNSGCGFFHMIKAGIIDMVTGEYTRRLQHDCASWRSYRCNGQMVPPIGDLRPVYASENFIVGCAVRWITLSWIVWHWQRSRLYSRLTVSPFNDNYQDVPLENKNKWSYFFLFFAACTCSQSLLHYLGPSCLTP